MAGPISIFIAPPGRESGWAGQSRNWSRRRAFVSAISALLLGGAFLASAAADQRQDVNKNIEATEKSIKAGRVQQRAFSAQARAARDQVEGLRIRAAIAAHEIQREEAALSAIEERQAALHRQDREYRRRLERMRESMAGSIAALIRIERQPVAAFLAAPGTLLDTARGGRLLATALPSLHADAAAVGALLAAADKVRGQLSRAQRHHAAVVATLSGQRRELQELLRVQANSEQQLWQAGAAEGRRLAALAAKASDLRALLQRLNSDEQRRQARRAQNPAASAAPATARKSAPNTAPEATSESARPEAETAAGSDEQRRRKFAAHMARVLAASKAKNSSNGQKQGAQAKRQRLAMAPARVPFSKIRGHLQLPARGKRVGNFGESTGFGPSAQGITIQTRKEAQVVVPYDGRVVFAGPFRDYGLILIISHGEGYHTLLAGLSMLQAVVGQSLLTGEPAGRMGGDGKRSLYIEIRRNGVAINPNSWWSSSRERASG